MYENKGGRKVDMLGFGEEEGRRCLGRGGIIVVYRGSDLGRD